MTITGVITALVLGAIIGSAGRLVARSRVAPWVATLLGVVGAFGGTGVARIVGVPLATSGIDWLELSLQVVVAAVLVGLTSALHRRMARPAAPVILPTAPGPVTGSPVPRVGPRAARPRLGEQAPSRIFLCYRRSDTSHAAGRLADRLRQRYGQDSIFMDVDSIPSGQNFRTGVRAAIESSAVVLVLIGDAWVTERDVNGRRLDNPDDNVRQEVELALQLDRALPVLVDGAAMPYAQALPPPLALLSDLNAAPLSHLTWDDDATRLIRAIDGRRPTFPR